MVNPATGETVKVFQDISDHALQAAIAAADEAHRTLSASTSIADRAALIRRVAELCAARRENFADIIVREMGKPREQALGEVDFTAAIYGYYGDNAESIMADEQILLLAGAGSAIVRRSSLGVLLGIMRGTSRTTRSRASPARISSSATRSCSSMRSSARSPLAPWRRCQGGRDRRALPQEGRSRTRRIVADLYDEFLTKFTERMSAVEQGDPTQEATAIGPLSSDRAADTIQEQVARAVAQGATLHSGGTRNGNYFSTTILTGVPPGSDAYHEEFFGPVAQVFKVADEQEAVELANDTPFGLGSYVFTTDRAQALRVADKIQAGMVFVNVVGADGAELPFGGVKRSGSGRELGSYGADEFVNKKLTRIG